jgi:hypothetical protein
VSLHQRFGLTRFFDFCLHCGFYSDGDGDQYANSSSQYENTFVLGNELAPRGDRAKGEQATKKYVLRLAPASS